MAADPMSLSDSRSTRAGTGIGIALAIAATVGAIAFLAPRLREEMREDIFSGTAARAVVPAPASTRGVATAPASPRAAVAPVSTPTAVPTPQPVALKPATQIVPAGSLAPGEAEIAPAAPVRAAPRTSPKPHHVRPIRKNPVERSARAPSPRLAVDDSLAGRPVAPAPRARPAEPRREAHRGERLVGGIHRENPFDYRTWRTHRNPDAPGSSPLDRQPG